MKVRWTKSSLRLRITPTELATLTRGEPVRESLQPFGAPDGSGWHVTLTPGATQTALSASGGEIGFAIAKGDFPRLADPESEGVYFAQDGFTFFVEKDFPCVHPRAAEIATGETETETFTPPSGFDERKG